MYINIMLFIRIDDGRMWKYLWQLSNEIYYGIKKLWSDRRFIIHYEHIDDFYNQINL